MRKKKRKNRDGHKRGREGGREEKHLPSITLQVAQHHHRLPQHNRLKCPIIQPTIPRPPKPAPRPHPLHHMRHRPPSLPPSLPPSSIEEVVLSEHVQVGRPESALHETCAIIEPEGD